MLHSGDQKHPEPLLLSRTHSGQNGLEIAHGAGGRNRTISHAVIQDEFPAASLESRQIRINSVHDLPDLLVGHVHLSLQVKPPPLPCRVVVRDLEGCDPWNRWHFLIAWNRPAIL